ncbi:Type 1 glutamine amidotransferase-like domain-containing protein [Streptomyces niveus]|uniref:Type 1 glutamine amidotransferase-like domain-containing protein n=1 Tax=Streptomyces niveus TaxID=193462 RepID=UPI000AB4571C
MAARPTRRLVLIGGGVVYVGGGNTANLLAVWRAHGLDRLPREAYDGGTLMCGISAGANCWGEGSHTDSFGPLTFLPDGLGLLAGSVCPHYDSEPGRRPSYRKAVGTGMLPAGWAVDDGVGALFEDALLTEAVTRVPEAVLYRSSQAASGRWRAVCSRGGRDPHRPHADRLARTGVRSVRRA